MATTEGILTLESPPRLSFSENVNLDGKLTGDDFRPAEAAAGSIDFNFSVIFQSSNSTDSSDADELFSDGKLLPFFRTTTTVPAATEYNNSGLQPPRSTFDAISESSAGKGGIASGQHRRDNSRHSIWRFGRSSSVGSVAPTGQILPYFPPLHRSKSTGSFFPTPPLAAGNKAAAASKKFAGDSNQRKTYYYSGSKRGSHRSAGGGVRITPVLNVPAPPMISRGGGGGGSGSPSAAVSSIFYYLLCSCGGEERLEKPEPAHCNPTKRNGTEPVSLTRVL